MGVSSSFQHFGNNAHSFRPHETFPFSLLLDTCKSSISADVAPYLMCMKPHKICIETCLISPSHSTKGHPWTHWHAILEMLTFSNHCHIMSHYNRANKGQCRTHLKGRVKLCHPFLLLHLNLCFVKSAIPQQTRHEDK